MADNNTELFDAGSMDCYVLALVETSQMFIGINLVCHYILDIFKSYLPGRVCWSLSAEYERRKRQRVKERGKEKKYENQREDWVMQAEPEVKQIQRTSANGSSD